MPFDDIETGVSPLLRDLDLHSRVFGDRLNIAQHLRNKLLCALVLGLLIWTAYGVYSNQTTTIQNYAMRVLFQDLALADYEP